MESERPNRGPPPAPPWWTNPGTTGPGLFDDLNMDLVYDALVGAAVGSMFGIMVGLVLNSVGG